MKYGRGKIHCRADGGETLCGRWNLDKLTSLRIKMFARLGPSKHVCKICRRVYDRLKKEQD